MSEPTREAEMGTRRLVFLGVDGSLTGPGLQGFALNRPGFIGGS